MGPLFGVLSFLSLVTLVVGLVKPAWLNKIFGGAATRKKIGWTFGVAIIVLFVIGIVITPSDNTQTPTTSDQSPTAANATDTVSDTVANLPQLHGGVAFRVGPPQEGNLVINNDQGNVGIISIKNEDSFTWKNCTVGVGAPGSVVEQVAEQMSHESEDVVGDVPSGQNFDVMATMLGMKEDDFRTLSSLVLACDNGQAQISNIAAKFNDIAPLKFQVQN